ncbi:hypothetical protein H5123_09225 [Shewanella sp. SR43-4]|jgi:hypothetical protein|uniref:hypothetical protein n=1 Tax=Shewanella sp. SR43-4 TaxID=2760942 RepID=UPI0015F89CD4|nr:hypothetical protein [Shewanella sp. SR43-4]MBB1317822.1 hypothetical protein [Shewanella sp. SR43-4]
MGEAGNIEAIAKLVSERLFNWFKWYKFPLTDVNWECVKEDHCKKTHPSDVVFYYLDPYTGHHIYINTDLKSYAKDSITKTSITTALSNLSLSVDCARVSQDWQKLYIVSDIDYGDVGGLLFIYNHDGDYDKGLSEIVLKLDSNKLPIAENTKITLMDPITIRRLNNVVVDIKDMVANEKFTKSNYTFFYPDLVRSKRKGDEWDQPASIEALTAPWLTLKYKASIGSGEEGYVIYYHRKGETVDEFIYLLDALSRQQLLLSNKAIELRLTDASKIAIVNFEKAKIEYLSVWGLDDSREAQINRIKAGHIEQLSQYFSDIQIGMRDNDK